MKTYLRRRRLLPLAMLGLLVALLGLLAQPQGKAHAATATFISCPTETALRTAISNASSGDTIQFLITGSPCTISLTTGPIVIDKDLTFDASKSAQPVTLDGGNTVQVLQVNSGTFTLNTLTIAHGSAVDGAGLFADTGSTVNITNSTFINNSATNIAPSGGGGLFADTGSTVNITNSIFNNNSSTGYGAGLLVRGSTMTISNSTIANNSAVGAGGIEIESGGTGSISNSTIANNSATGYGHGGGGIGNEGSSTLSISNSTIANNAVTNTTNTGGGGIVNDSNSTLSISNSTIANNSVIGSNVDGGGIFNIGGSATTTIAQSIVANNTINNTTGNCTATPPITDQGYNLENGTDCGFTGTGSLQNADPQFDPIGLQNNGGPTWTIALQPTSPAIDHIPTNICAVTTDQRGVKRPQGSACDIGAFEATAADQIRVLINVVNSFHLPLEVQASLDASLQVALIAVNKGATPVACIQLRIFKLQVQAYQTVHKLTPGQATQLLAEAQHIQAFLGCS